MRYQDLKVGDAGRLALMALAMALVAAVCLGARATVQPLLGRQFWPAVTVMITLCPVTLAVAVWYLLSSPAQNARFLKWAEDNLRQKPGPGFDPALLDPNDPDYGVPTIKYLLARSRSRAS